jgi:hypothetical protein
MEGPIMKIIITGHTSGLGKYLYNQFKNSGHEIEGISRSNGFDLLTDIDRVIEISNGCDLFINNTNASKCQIELLNRLHDKVDKMIIMGSIAGDYDQLINNDYSKNKKELSERCKQLSLLVGNKLLHLNISMLEDAVSSDNLITYKEVYDTIEFWIKNPRISNLNFEFKLTPFTLEKIKEKFNASQESIDFVLKSMCDEKRKHF